VRDDGLILALDQGTTSSRAMLFDGRGTALASAQREVAPHFPRPGWVEQDPLEIWRSQVGTAREVLAGAATPVEPARGSTGTRRLAIAIANQRETTVVWERASSRPVAPAIVWQDRRTAADCERLRAEGREELFTARTGLVLDPYFSGTKLRWILRNAPGALTRARRGELAFGTVETWLTWLLTGGRVHVTDATNASRTLLYDLEAGDWDDELLELLGIPREVLPRVVDSSGVVGETVPGWAPAGWADKVPGRAPAGAGDDGLPGGLPIAGLAGDQQAALFGQACLTEGMAKVTYGTGCFLLAHAGDRRVASRERLLTTVACQLGGRRTYALEGSVFIGGAVVQWLRDGLRLGASSTEVAALAATADSSEGVCFVPALAGLGAPHWDPEARGAILGLTRGSTAAHIARAALEGIAFQVADLVACAESDMGRRLSEVRVDGGASANDQLMQFQADVLGVPVVRPTVLESTALGAAYLAGLTTGLWRDEDEVAAIWRAERRFAPGEGVERDVLLASWHKAIRAARAFGSGSGAGGGAEPCGGDSA
jgi:glycerol kinase